MEIDMNLAENWDDITVDDVSEAETAEETTEADGEEIEPETEPTEETTEGSEETEERNGASGTPPREDAGAAGVKRNGASGTPPREDAGAVGVKRNVTSDTPPREDAGATFKLKHLNEVRNVSREEVITLAQKGMDYDRIKQRLDGYAEIKAKAQARAPYEELIKELADEQHMTPEEFMDASRAAMLARREGIDVSIARERIKLDRREKALEQRERAGLYEGGQANENARREEDFSAFLNRYGDVDVKTIPKEVWDEVSRGARLTDAYMRWENRQLKAQLAAEKKNNANRAKSTGSQKSPAPEKRDDWDKSWYDE